MALARRVRTVRATATVGALLGGGFLEHEAARTPRAAATARRSGAGALWRDAARFITAHPISPRLRTGYEAIKFR